MLVPTVLLSSGSLTLIFLNFVHLVCVCVCVFCIPFHSYNKRLLLSYRIFIRGFYKQPHCVPSEVRGKM
jgi:hypothetical protein